MVHPAGRLHQRDHQWSNSSSLNVLPNCCWPWLKDAESSVQNKIWSPKSEGHRWSCQFHRQIYASRDATASRWNFSKSKCETLASDHSMSSIYVPFAYHMQWPKNSVESANVQSCRSIFVFWTLPYPSISRASLKMSSWCCHGLLPWPCGLFCRASELGRGAASGPRYTQTQTSTRRNLHCDPPNWSMLLARQLAIE